MKTSEEILNKWYKPLRGISEIAFIQITEAMREYAIEVAREALKNASENARVTAEDTVTGNKLEVLSWTDSDNFKFSVSKKSILDESNIPKL